MDERPRTARENVSYDEISEHGVTSSLISVTMVVEKGHIHIVPKGGGRFAARIDNRLPIREGLALLEMLGVKDQAVALMKAQAVLMADGARQRRSKASDDFREAMHRSGEQDADALRVLLTLEEVDKDAR